MTTEFAFFDPGALVDGELELILVATKHADPVKGWVPAYSFEMRDRERNASVGNVALRIGEAQTLVLYAGHVAYNVVPEARGRRFAARSLRLLLPLARRHGLKQIWITMNPDNHASRRSAEIAGAEFVETVDLPETNDMYADGDRQKMRYRLIVDAS
jgi:tagatose 1,6-diphosphate aldolase